MKKLFLTLFVLLVSQTTWALQQYDCGLVNGQTVLLEDWPTPILVMGGMHVYTVPYGRNGDTTYFITQDHRYALVCNQSYRWLYENDRGYTTLVATCMPIVPPAL